MTRLEIVNGSLQISSGGTVILVAPKNSCAIDVLALYRAIPFVVIYNKYLGNSTIIFNQPLSDCENSTGTPFNVATFIAFAETNFGFDIISPFRYDVNGNGIEPCLGSNNANAIYSTIGGGQNNCIVSGNSAFIGGGICNGIGNYNSTTPIPNTISGGQLNNICPISVVDIVTGCEGGHTIGGGKCNNVSPTPCGSPYVGENFMTIGGGYRNTVGQRYATVSGGYCNKAYFKGNTISGGSCNLTGAGQPYQTIGGGRSNFSSASYSIIGGGSSNTSSSGSYNSIGGGKSNSASSNNTTIGGGCLNTASGASSTVVGGCTNSASGACSLVGGGVCNTASATVSNIGGGCCNITNSRFSFIGGGQRNIIQSITNECCSLGVTIGGGIGHNTTGGTFCAITGDLTGAITCCNAGRLSTIGGGYRNCATGACSSINGGRQNIASGVLSAILGGGNNTSACACAMIVGANITANRVCATFVNNLSITQIPTVITGLPSGSVWSNAGVLNIVP